MPHELTLTDGTTTLDLAMTTDAGYHFVSFSAPRPNRQLARVSGFPFADGNRTTASSLQDVSAEIVVTIVGSDADDLDALLQALVKLLQAGQRWEEHKLGAPVRLLFARQGATNTSYRTVTGVPLMPEPVDADNINWLDLSSIGLELTVAFTVTLEPLAHAGELVGNVADAPIASNPDGNLIPLIPIDGSMPAPLAIVIENTSGLDPWVEAWIAEVSAVPLVQDYQGEVDADAWHGERNDIIAEGGEVEISTLNVVPDTSVPLRAFVRLKLISGTPGQVELQFRLSVSYSGMQVAPWVRFDGAVGDFHLIDLGTVRLPSLFSSRVHMGAASELRPHVVARMTDGSAFTLGVDYFEVLPILSFTRLSAEVANGDILVYEMVSKSGAFVWPSRVPQQYVTYADGNLIWDAQRYGQLSPLDPNDMPILWFALLHPGPHLMATSADVTVEYLPTYSLGLRGDD